MSKEVAVIISISSDIGRSLAMNWLKKGRKVYGTYRTFNEKLNDPKMQNAYLYQYDLSCAQNVAEFVQKISDEVEHWDILVFAAGLLDPVGCFFETDFREWEKSVFVNFTMQMQILHGLYSKRNQQRISKVIYFAGGGVNGAPINYSAYTVSKIALIKMVELISKETDDVGIFIIGPGWVKTKIHNSTMNAGLHDAGSNYHTTINRFKNNQFVDMQTVIDCINWFLKQPSDIISGRNYSVEFDPWGADEFIGILSSDEDIFKLRRYGNKIFFKE